MQEVAHFFVGIPYMAFDQVGGLMGLLGFVIIHLLLLGLFMIPIFLLSLFFRLFSRAFARALLWLGVVVYIALQGYFFFTFAV